ncbi:hypothetical protein [Desulfovibrio inopinatus]|uniref:hypothetical protein n=1 Tax=Desulfovibrio inopinatus TaxID=102109 RepID=UPI00040D52D8|nr:hypothetical protein [Desulfovibrio inopinatus]
MASTFLGQYLLQKNAVSEKALNEALAYQRKANNRIGELAIQEGVLSRKAVEAIIAAQRETDASFGDLAVRLGYLSQRQIDDLLFKQKVHSVYLGEALLELGHLSAEQYCHLLDEYVDEKKKRQENVHYLLEGYPENRFLSQMTEALQKAFFRFAGASVLLYHIGVDEQKEELSSESDLLGYAFYGKIPGKGCIYSVLRASASTFARLEETAAPSPLRPKGPLLLDILEVTTRYFIRFLEEDGNHLENSVWRRISEEEIAQNVTHGAQIDFDSQQGRLELFFTLTKDPDAVMEPKE